MILNRTIKKYKRRRFKTFQIKNNQNNQDKQNNEDKYELFHDEKECFICLEVNLDNLKTLKLNNMNDYIKECLCDGWIHENCLSKWHIVNKHCPICRSVIIFTKYEYYILSIHSFKKNMFELLLIVCRIIKQTLLSSLFLWFLYRVCLSHFKKTPTLSN